MQLLEIPTFAKESSSCTVNHVDPQHVPQQVPFHAIDKTCPSSSASFHEKLDLSLLS